jgi:hypothetical protein
MINIQEFIDSKRIKLPYRILHEPLESWNAIGKYWQTWTQFFILSIIDFHISSFCIL